MAARHAAAPPGREIGLQLIVAYKAIKAVAEVALAVAVVALARGGRLDSVREYAIALEHHVGSRWAVLVGHAIVELLSTRGLHLVQLGLALDGAFSAFEGWSLWRRFAWAPWLVVVATSTPLPLEIAHVVHTGRLSRLVIVLLNVLVVAYLARRILRERAARRPRTEGA